MQNSKLQTPDSKPYTLNLNPKSETVDRQTLDSEAWTLDPKPWAPKGTTPSSFVAGQLSTQNARHRDSRGSIGRGGGYLGLGCYHIGFRALPFRTQG